MKKKEIYQLIYTFIDHGADVNLKDNEGLPLLHQAILRQCTEAALFLLNQKVDLNIKYFEIRFIIWFYSIKLKFKKKIQ